MYEVRNLTANVISNDKVEDDRQLFLDILMGNLLHDYAQGPCYFDKGTNTYKITQSLVKKTRCSSTGIQVCSIEECIKASCYKA